MQSYQNVSNSQLYKLCNLCIYGCKRLCKVIKMLAIHNQVFFVCLLYLVANAYAKLSKCQQFTTRDSAIINLILLQTLMQSYQNVSNSQRRTCKTKQVYGCKRLCKVIKMLAIHNEKVIERNDYKVANAYAKLSKCQQFTTQVIIQHSQRLLQTLMQSYQNVSNSQLHFRCSSFKICCKRLCKVIKMLAIHNKWSY